MCSRVQTIRFARNDFALNTGLSGDVMVHLPGRVGPRITERYARVYLPNGLDWCARYNSASEWLQVDLGILTKVPAYLFTYFMA